MSGWVEGDLPTAPQRRHCRSHWPPGDGIERTPPLTALTPTFPLYIFTIRRGPQGCCHDLAGPESAWPQPATAARFSGCKQLDRMCGRNVLMSSGGKAIDVLCHHCDFQSYSDAGRWFGNIAFHPSNWMHGVGIPSSRALAWKNGGCRAKFQKVKTAAMRLAAMFGESIAFPDTKCETAECTLTIASRRQTREAACSIAARQPPSAEGRANAE